MFDDIWFTYKARIAAELRLKNNDVHSQAILIWYAVASAAAGIVGIRFDKFAGPNTDIYMVVLSMALLVVSLFVANRDYRGRAMMMRANHIALKKLYEELKSGAIKPELKPELYSKLLLECENHSSYDDRYFRVFNPKGLTRSPSGTDCALTVGMLVVRVLGFGLLYALPVALVCFAGK